MPHSQSTCRRRSRPIVSGSLALLLTACASGPSVESEPGAQNTRARFLLGELVNQGKVPVVAAGDPAFIDQTAAIRDFASGVRSMTVVFDATTDPAVLDKQRVVLRWGTRSADICSTMPTASGGGAAPFTAAFCDGSETVASVIANERADSADNEKRLMWRAANRLFPDDYADSYGLGVGLFGGSGGVGIGGGLSF